MSPALLGFVRGLIFAVVLSGLAYVGDAAHLSGILSASMATVVASLALGLEHAVEGGTGNALFGAVRTRV